MCNLVSTTKQPFHNTIHIEEGVRLVINGGGGQAQILLANDYQQSIRLIATYEPGFWSHPNTEASDWFWYCAKRHSKSINKIVKIAVEYNVEKAFERKWYCFLRRLRLKRTRAARKLSTMFHNICTIY